MVEMKRENAFVTVERTLTAENYKSYLNSITVWSPPYLMKEPCQTFYNFKISQMT